MLKTAGYIVSILSVLLLGAVAWKGAREEPGMMVMLLAGMATSVAGMFLRWLAFLDERRKLKAARQAASAPRPAQR